MEPKVKIADIVNEYFEAVAAAEGYPEGARKEFAERQKKLLAEKFEKIPNIKEVIKAAVGA